MFKFLSCLLAVGLLGAAPAHAKTVYSNLGTWITAIPEAPDYTEDFETGFADGDIYTGTGTMSLSAATGFSASDFLIETGAGSISGSNPIDDFALELPSSAVDIVTLNFSTAITYLGLFYIDAGSPSIDGTSFANTGVSGDSNLFAGFTFLPGENVTSIQISSVSGDSTWGIDNIYWGSDIVAPVPLPAALPLLLAGLGALSIARRKRR